MGRTIDVEAVARDVRAHLEAAVTGTVVFVRRDGSVGIELAGVRSPAFERREHAAAVFVANHVRPGEDEVLERVRHGLSKLEPAAHPDTALSRLAAREPKIPRS
jgi:predicted nucleotidyltransferase